MSSLLLSRKSSFFVHVHTHIAHLGSAIQNFFSLRVASFDFTLEVFHCISVNDESFVAFRVDAPAHISDFRVMRFSKHPLAKTIM